MEETGISGEIAKIIDASALEPHLKKALSDALGAIARRQDRLVGQLRNNMELELQSQREFKSIDFSTRTALAPNARLKDLEAFGFYEMPCKTSQNRQLDFETIYRQIFFLAAPYEQFLPLCEKRFQGHAANGSFEYGFSPFYGYVEAEKKLDPLFRLYGFQGGRPFSPWSRRAVGIRVYGEPGGDVDLCLARNGLSDILLADKGIVWNLEFRDNEKSGAVRIAPRDDGVVWNYYYTASDDGARLWPLPDEVLSGCVEPEQIDASFASDDLILSSRKEFASLSCQKIRLHEDARAPNLQIFDSKIEKGAPQFPASRAQFNRLLVCFAKGEFGSRMGTGNGGKVIPRYQSGHRSSLLPGQTLLGARRNALDVEFYCDGDPGIFLADYANWVLEELERRFPLFSWRGFYA